MFNIPKNGLTINDNNNLPNALSFFFERIKPEKLKKFEANSHDWKEYVICIRSLKQALSDGLVLRKVHRAIKFNEKAKS